MPDSASAPAPGAPPRTGSSTLILLMVFPVLMIVILNPELRIALGSGVGGVFDPVFGFGGEYPIWTLFATSLVLVVFTTIVRHFFTDWVAAGKQKHLSDWVQKQYRNVRLRGNVTKMKKLNQFQSDIMRQSTDTMGAQMKTTLVTIVVAMAIFLWLGVFMYSGTGSNFFSVPWSPTVNYHQPGPFLHLLPTWIVLYSVLSLPLGQVLQSVLKIWSFRRKLDTLPRRSGNPNKEVAGE